MREQRDFLKHHADAASFRRDMEAVSGNRLPVDQDPTGFKPFQSGTEAKQSALSASRWPQETQNLARSYRQADLIHGQRGPIVMADLLQLKPLCCRHRTADPGRA